MHGRLKAALVALTAVVVAGSGVVVAANAADPVPQIAAGLGSCTTDSKGVCALKHTLGSVPDVIVVSANTPGSYNGFILNTVNGSFTATDFKVRAMFNQTTPKAGGTIWVSWVAYAKGVAPPPPPTSTTVVPPPTSTTPVPPTTTTVTPPPTTTTPPPAGTCAGGKAPTKIVEQDGRTFDAPGTGGGAFYVHNDAWNWQGHGEGQYEYLYLCDQKSWYVDSWGFDTPEGEVFMYPSSKFDVTGSCCGGKPLSTWPNQVLGKFGGTVSGYGAGSSWNVAWDLWLNGVASGNYTELMIWTQHGGNAAPAGSRRADWTAPDGNVYEVYWDGNTFEKAGGSYLAFISKTPQVSGTVDIRAFIAESAARGYINANPTLNQLNFGIEVRDTGAATQANPARFTLTDYGLTLS